MVNEQIKLIHKGKSFEIDLKVCNWFTKFSGLMFTRREKARALLFYFNKPTRIAIHSWFVFFPFIAIWLDSENKIIEWKIVKSFKNPLRPKKSFYKLIEIPISKQYKEIVKFFNIFS